MRLSIQGEASALIIRCSKPYHASCNRVVRDDRKFIAALPNSRAL